MEIYNSSDFNYITTYINNVCYIINKPNLNDNYIILGHKELYIGYGKFIDFKQLNKLYPVYFLKSKNNIKCSEKYIYHIIKSYMRDNLYELNNDKQKLDFHFYKDLKIDVVHYIIEDIIIEAHDIGDSMLKNGCDYQSVLNVINKIINDKSINFINNNLIVNNKDNLSIDNIPKNFLKDIIRLINN
jgi:hypothetical protein